MKRFATLGLALAILLAFVAVSVPPTVEAQNAGLVSSILNRMERNRRDLKSLRANISMVKYDSRIRADETYQGNVLYMPATGAQRLYASGLAIACRETLAVADGEYTLFRPL